MHQFQKLSVWKKAMEVAKMVYEVSRSFPEEERFGLTIQIRRCAVSVPSNIAEGSGRNSSKEFIYYLGIAAGSASELFTQVILAYDLNYLKDSDMEFINAEISYILNMIHRLQEKLS